MAASPEVRTTTSLFPPGTPCTLAGTRVLGNVTVQTGSALIVESGTTIGGNISASGCDFVHINTTGTGGIVVGGNVTITNCTAFPQGAVGSASFPVLIGGNVTCNGNATFCQFQSANIGKNVTCNNNGEGCQFALGTIGQNITCSDNLSSAGCSLDSETVGKNATMSNNAPANNLADVLIGGNLSCSGTSASFGTNLIAGNASGTCSGF